MEMFSPEYRGQQVHENDYAEQKTDDQEHRHPNSALDGNRRRLRDRGNRRCRACKRFRLNRVSGSHLITFNLERDHASAFCSQELCRLEAVTD